MSNYKVADSELTAVANAIRTRGRISGQLSFPNGFVSAINSMHTETLGPKTITHNGQYNPVSDSVDGYSSVNVNVPNSYGISDEGKVVDGGALVAQTVRQQAITNNGTYQTQKYSSVTVNVPSSGGGSAVLKTKNITANGSYDAGNDNADGYSGVTVNVPNSYAPADEGKIVSGGALVNQTSATKTANGAYDTTANNEIIINVPNSYTELDEGKVVSNGELVAQTTRNVSANGTYDTTQNNSVSVSVPLGSKNITTNGTYLASADDLAGYSTVVVNVPNAYAAGDEGKVVSNGALVSQTSRNISGTGTYDTTTNNSITIISTDWLQFTSTAGEYVS